MLLFSPEKVIFMLEPKGSIEIYWTCLRHRVFLNLESTLPCSNGAGCVLDTITDFFDQVGQETMHATGGNKHFRLNNVTVRPIFLE